MKKNQVKKKLIRSKILRRKMTIDLRDLEQYQHFWLKDSATYANSIWQEIADRYINIPSYLDLPGPLKRKYELKKNKHIVHHHNHDVTHAIRQRKYTQLYLDILSKCGTSQTKTLVEYLRTHPEVSTCLEMASFLCRAGRTNELPGKKDPSNAKRSGQLVNAIANAIGIDAGLANLLEFCVAEHHPQIEAFSSFVKPLFPELAMEEKLLLAQLLKAIIDLSHHTDLVRCKKGTLQDNIEGQIEDDLHKFIDTNLEDASEIAFKMMRYAAQACKITGTRVKHHRWRQTKNNVSKKVAASQNVDACMKKLDSLSQTEKFVTYGRPRTHTIERPELEKVATNTASFVASRLEVSHLASNPLAFLEQPSQFATSKTFSHVKKIRIIENKNLTEIYSQRSTATTRAGLFSQLNDPALRIQEKLADDELLLFHGTSATGLKHISKYGFNSDFSQRNPLTGYGALGKGIYFATDFSKAAVYSRCSVCNSPKTCLCIEEATQEPVERVVLACKAVIQNPKIVTRKKLPLRHKNVTSRNYDSCIGLSKTIIPSSEFRSTEICIPNSERVKPVYEVRFISQPNLLDPTTLNIFLKSVDYPKDSFLDTALNCILENIRLMSLSSDSYIKYKDITLNHIGTVLKIIQTSSNMVSAQNGLMLKKIMISLGAQLKKAPSFKSTQSFLGPIKKILYPSFLQIRLLKNIVIRKLDIMVIQRTVSPEKIFSVIDLLLMRQSLKRASNSNAYHRVFLASFLDSLRSDLEFIRDSGSFNLEKTCSTIENALKRLLDEAKPTPESKARITDSTVCKSITRLLEACSLKASNAIATMNCQF